MCKLSIQNRDVLLELTIAIKHVINELDFRPAGGTSRNLSELVAQCGVQMDEVCDVLNEKFRDYRFDVDNQDWPVKGLRSSEMKKMSLEDIAIWIRANANLIK